MHAAVVAAVSTLTSAAELIISFADSFDSVREVSLEACELSVAIVDKVIPVMPSIPGGASFGAGNAEFFALFSIGSDTGGGTCKPGAALILQFPAPVGMTTLALTLALLGLESIERSRPPMSKCT